MLKSTSAKINSHLTSFIQAKIRMSSFTKSDTKKSKLNFNLLPEVMLFSLGIDE